MPGLISAMQGFCVIGIVIAVGYVAARMRIGGPSAQMVLNRFSFFVSSPCLMFAILSKEPIFDIFHPSIIVAFFSAVLVGRGVFGAQPYVLPPECPGRHHRCLNSLYLNSNNIGLPIATYILAIRLLWHRFCHAAGHLHTGGPDSAGRDHQGKVSIKKSPSSHCISRCLSVRCWALVGLCDFR